MILHITRATGSLIIWLIIAGAVFSTVVRIVLPGLKAYKSELETRISQVLDVPVTIGKMRAGLLGFNPELVLTDIEISPVGGSKPAITLREIRIGLDVLEILLDQGLLSATMVTLIGAELSVTRNKDGTISIVGLKASDEKPTWLLDGGRYEMLDSNVTWEDKKRNGKVLYFEHVDFFIDNDFGIKDHQINIAVKLNDQYGDFLRLSMHFNGNMFVSGDIDALLYVEGRNIHLEELLAGDLPLGLQFKSGTSDFKLWSEWRDTRMTSLMGEVKATQAQVILKNQKPFLMESLATHFQWHNKNKQWELGVRNFNLQVDKKVWPEANFSIWAETSRENPLEKLGANISSVDINEVCDLLHLSSQLDEKQAKRLKKIDPRGQIKNLLIYAEPGKDKFAVNGGVENINISALDKIPELSNFTAYFKGTNQQGFLRLATYDGEFYFPRLFRNSLELKKLIGKVEWKQDDENWHLSSNMIELDSPDIQTRNRVKMKIPRKKGNIFLDYQIYFFNGKNAAIAKKYFPTGIMGKGIVKWLDKAFYAGNISQGGGIFYGDLVDYPFYDGQGVFEVLFDAEAGDIDYSPDWPRVYDVNAEVLFFRESLQITFNHARIKGAKITHAVASIDSIFKTNASEHLELNGEVEGTFDQVKTFLQHSPLNDEAGKVFDVIAPVGSTNISVDMKIPLEENAELWMEGVARLKNAELSILSLDLPVTAINGNLNFNKGGVFSDGIEAIGLGYPVYLNIVNNLEQTRFRVNGKTDIDNLQKQFPSSWWSATAGQGEYSLLLTVPHDDQKSAKLLLTSDLQGFFLDLPESLAKSETQSRPFYVHLDFQDIRFLQGTVNYDNVLQVDFQLDRDRRELYAAEVLYGTGRVEQSREAGISLTINQDHFSVQPWLDFGEVHMDKNSAKSLAIQDIQFNSQHLIWQKKDLGKIDLHLQKQKQQWLGDITTHMATGKLNLPDSMSHDGTIILDMDYLDLSALSDLSMEGDPVSPVDFPLMNIHSRKLYWNGVNLGELVMETGRISKGFAFNQVNVTSDDWSLSMQGACETEGSSIITKGKGRFKASSLGDFLAQMQFTNEMKESRADIDFSLQWEGAPYQFSLASVSGDLDMNVGEGRLLGIEPGIGRILGAFDLAQWKRRVRMDFSDVFAAGLAYNGIKGSFELANGYADTNDLAIDAVAAKFEIKGQTGLVEHSYNQQITVTPKTTAVIPFAGTIAGLMVKQLTGTHPDSLTRSYYSLKGNWDKPEYKKLNREKGGKPERKARKMNFSQLKE